jgi:DNA-binding transcriptional regulator GbsR (MarR family)
VTDSITRKQQGGAGPDDLRHDLREAEDRFISVWGEMAGSWGISRTMAEIHAVLYITGQPLSMDDLMERLEISRGNASMSVRSLLEWGIISRTHKRGDRKEYFQAEQDVWAMFRAIVRERMKREAEPLLAELHEIRDLTGSRAKPTSASEKRDLAEMNRRLESLLNFFQMLNVLSERFVSPAGRGLQEAASLLGRVKSSLKRE